VAPYIRIRDARSESQSLSGAIGWSECRCRPSAAVCKRPLSGWLLPCLIIAADGFVSPASNKPRRVAGVFIWIKRVGCYYVLFVVYQICGATLTPDFSIALFNSGDAANALACSRLWKT